MGLRAMKIEQNMFHPASVPRSYSQQLGNMRASNEGCGAESRTCAISTGAGVGRRISSSRYSVSRIIPHHPAQSSFCPRLRLAILSYTSACAWSHGVFSAARSLFQGRERRVMQQSLFLCCQLARLCKGRVVLGKI